MSRYFSFIPSLVRRGPLRRLASRVLPRAAVLVYHRTGDAGSDPFGQTVSPDHFACQLEHLKRHHHVLSLPALLEKLPRRSFPDGTFAVTFDDGYVDNLTVAYPVAREADVPITVFVTVEPVLTEGSFWWDELAVLTEGVPLSTKDIEIEGLSPIPLQSEADRATLRNTLQRTLKRMTPTARTRVLDALRARVHRPVPGGQGRPMNVAELCDLAARSGVTIGAHTMTHPTLASLSTAEQWHELAESRRQLEHLLGHPVTLLAYPFGKTDDVSRQTPRLAARAGYHAAFSTVPRCVPPLPRRYALPRLTIHNWNETDFARRLQTLLGEST